MPARTLVWTGNAGDNNFATAGNWQNAQDGHTAKKAPHHHDTVELLGSGTITGTGAVAALDVEGSFLLQSATITANTVTDTGVLAVGATQIRSRAITVGSATQGGIMNVENATLSAIGPSLDLSIGGAGYNGMYVEQTTLALGTGTLAVGTASGGGFLNAMLTTISAAMLEIGNGGGEVTLEVCFVTLGSANGVGLSIGGGPGQGGRLNLEGGSLTVKGAVDVGTQSAGSIYFEHPTTLTTLNGVTLGGTGGSDGGLSIAGTWNDTGNVIVNNGSALGLVLSETIGTIRGNLAMAAENNNVLSSIGAALNVSGTVSLQADGGYNYTPIALFQNGASLTCGALDLQCNGTPPAVAQFETGASLTTGDLSITGAFNLQTTGATLTVLRTLELGADGTLTTTTAQIGDRTNATAASIGGTLAITSTGASIDGTLALTGGLLDISSSSLSLTAHGTALAASGGTVDVAGTSNSAATLVTAGGIALLNGSSLTIDYSNVSATTAGGQPAFTMDATSSLYLGPGTLTLNGDADIAGQMKIQGTFTELGSMTIAATGSINAWGTVIIAGPVDNLGHFTANFDTPDFMGPVTGTGTFATGVSAALAFQGSVAAGVTVDISGGGTVTIGDAADFHATIADWGYLDSLDLLNLAATSDSVTGQTLTLYDSNNAVLANLQFAQPISQNNFVLQQDGHGDTVISYHI